MTLTPERQRTYSWSEPAELAAAATGRLLPHATSTWLLRPEAGR